MNNEDILKSDLLDIVFDKRNKAYGAYELRKHYKRRLVKSLVTAFVLAAGIACITLFIKKEKGIRIKIAETEYAIFKEVEVPKEKPAEIKKPEALKPLPPAANKPLAQQQYVANIDITTDPLQASKINTLDDNKAFGGQNVEGAPTSTVIVPPPTKIDEGGNDLPVAKIDRETPTASPDVMPSYPGGMAALRKFLEKNLKSFDDIEEGKVISVKITFVVGYDGKLKGFQVLENGGDIYNNEVIRVLKKMPEWIPGKANGENVSVYYTIPVKFTAAE